jgi:hypothetical protein
MKVSTAIAPETSALRVGSRFTGQIHQCKDGTILRIATLPFIEGEGYVAIGTVFDDQLDSDPNPEAAVCWAVFSATEAGRIEADLRSAAQSGNARMHTYDVNQATGDVGRLAPGLRCRPMEFRKTIEWIEALDLPRQIEGGGLAVWNSADGYDHALNRKEKMLARYQGVVERRQKLVAELARIWTYKSMQNRSDYRGAEWLPEFVREIIRERSRWWLQLPEAAPPPLPQSQCRPIAAR